MAQKYFAMDFAFYSSMGAYSFRDRCEITRAAGYDAMLLSIWDGRNWAQASEMETMKSRHGVEPAGVYVVLNLAVGEEDPRIAGIVGAALNADDRTTYYGGGEKGYTDYPSLAQERGQAPKACVDENWR